MQKCLTARSCGSNRKTVPACTNCDVQLQNVAPDDGLKSPKHVEHLMINKDTLQEFVHLVGLLIYTLQVESFTFIRIVIILLQNMK